MERQAVEISIIIEYILPLLAFVVGAFVMWLTVKMRSLKRRGVPGEQTARNEIIFSAANSALYYKNLQTNKEWFSRAFLELSQISHKQPEFQHLQGWLTEASFEHIKQRIIDLQAGEEEVHVELESRDGKPIKCIGMVQLRGVDRHLVLWWRDVTHFKRQIAGLEHENEQLKRESQMLTSLLNATPFPIWMRDESLAIKYCNLAHIEACEEKAEHSGDEALELYLQGRALAKKALGDNSRARERRHIVIEGDRHLHDIIETPCEVEGVRHSAGIAVDMNEMDALAQELERTKSSQSDLLEGTNSAMAIYSADMRLQFYNNSFKSLWKLEEEWLRTKPNYSDILEKLRENRSLPEQANFPAFKQQHLKLFTDLIEPNEEFLYLPDGRTIRVLAIPHTFGGVLFAYEDVTDRLALERSYNTLIAVQKETLDNLHEGVAVFGEDGRLKLSNPIYMQMWNVNEEIVKSQPHISDLLSRHKRLFYFDNWDDFKARFISEMQRREVASSHIERTDGKVFNLIKVPLPDGQILLNYVDITDSVLVERSLREKNEALEEADHVKSEFLANISYELRSPLTSISGFAEMLKLNYLGELNNQQRDYISNIEQASKHLSSLIDDILDIASIEAGYMQLDVKPIDIYPLLQSMQELVRQRAEQNNIQLLLQCEPSIGQLAADEERVRQVMYNLLVNAIKYTDTGSSITLGARAADNDRDEVVLWVQDEGIGIPEDEQDAVFNKFFRSTAAKKRQSSGTGLGLSMVKSFVELHGGHVELRSQVGDGTLIECYFPRHGQPQGDN